MREWARTRRGIRKGCHDLRPRQRQRHQPHLVDCIDDVIFQVGQNLCRHHSLVMTRACMGRRLSRWCWSTRASGVRTRPQPIGELVGQFAYPYPRTGIPAFEQRAGLAQRPWPQNTREMASTGQVKAGGHGGRDGQKSERDGPSRTQTADVTAAPHDGPANAGGEGSDP